jgi:photosystem II stability/assembly factor-like uncharacterized protein
MMAAASAAPVGPALERPALMVRTPASAVLQAAARAGDRVVAVGERGLVLVSDDEGARWRQVPTPVSVGLTAVRFADDRLGWAVGHGGVVLVSRDGGERWTRQFDGAQAAALLLKQAQASGEERAVANARRLVAEGPDKPLFDLHVSDQGRLWVVGAYNLAFHSDDGGEQWAPLRLDNPKGLHLYALRARGSELVVCGEQGLVLRSVDGGASFQRIATPYQGSYFTLELTGEKEIVVAGLRGNVWRSGDAGRSWMRQAVPVDASITASARDAQGRLLLVSQAGMLLGDQAGRLEVMASGLPPLNGLLPLQDGSVLGLSVAGAVKIASGPAARAVAQGQSK